MCNVDSKRKMNLEAEKPSERPAPETVTVEASVERAEENAYFSIRKHGKTTEDVDNDKNDEDSVYESIRGEPESPDMTPEPKDAGWCKNLSDPSLHESSSL